jgi:hypothetical protein
MFEKEKYFYLMHCYIEFQMPKVEAKINKFKQHVVTLETAERSESDSEISESSSESEESEEEVVAKPVVKTKTVVKKPAVVVEKKEKESPLPSKPVLPTPPVVKKPLSKAKIEQLAKARQARIDKNAMSKAEENEIIELQGALVEAELQKRLTKKIYKSVSAKIRKERLEQLKTATKDIPSDEEKEQEKPKQKQKESLYAKLLGF